MALESFFLMGAKPLVEDSPTWKLHQFSDWEAVSRKLKGLYRWEQTHAGGLHCPSEKAMRAKPT